MSEKRFIVESVIITKDCNEDKSRIVKVITDKEELYSYDDLYEISYLLNELSDENRQLKEENERLKRELYVVETDCKNAKESRNHYREENEQLRRYVYHCPQICNIILAYLRKSETEDVKAVSDAMGDDKYFDEEIDTLRSWE